MAKGIYVGVESQLVRGDIIPKNWTYVSYTKYTAEDGTELTSGAYKNADTTVKNACDGDTSTVYNTGSINYSERYVQLKFPEAKKITKMKLKFSTSLLANWKIQCSNNGSSWVDLYTSTTLPTELTEITLNNPDYYTFYKLLVTLSLSSSQSTNTVVYELQTSEYETPEVKSVAHKVKKAYIGLGPETKTGNIIPNSWVLNSDGEQVASDGTKLSAYVRNRSTGVISKESYVGAELCDGDESTYYNVYGEEQALYKFEFAKPQKILEIMLKFWMSAYGNFSSIYIQGSNDDSSWKNLLQISTYTEEFKKYTLTNTDYYKYYRIFCQTKAYSGDTIRIYEFQTSKYEITGARKIKKGYIGVGGIARHFYSSETVLSYYGEATELLQGRYRLTAASVGNYALFGGGQISNTAYTATVDTYNSSLVKSTATGLTNAKIELAATSIGDYALFGGGYVIGTGGMTTIDAYNSLLVKGTATGLSQGRYKLTATSVGNYALFGGGTTNGSYSSSNVDTYTSSLTKGTTTNLSTGRYDLAATTVGDFALFGGGAYSDSNFREEVDSYTSSLVKGTPSTLVSDARALAATTVGDFALFGGGRATLKYSYGVTSYTSSLVKGTPPYLTEAKQYLAATTVGDFALFGGGSDGNSRYATVDTYTSALVKGTATNLSVARTQLAATSIGDYALFGGGYDDEVSTTVDVYQTI